MNVPRCLAAWLLILSAYAQQSSERLVSEYTQLIKAKPRSSELLNLRGAEHFKLGRVKEALADFDRALEVDPNRAPYYWQRGIALYYAGRYEEGRIQFELSQTVNENDFENAIWRYLCIAKSKGVPAARAALVPIQGDVRAPMSQIYSLYRGDGKVEDVTAAVKNPSASFYANVYLGLYYDANGDTKAARDHLTQAAAYKADNYMADVARVHLKLMK